MTRALPSRVRSSPTALLASLGMLWGLGACGHEPLEPVGPFAPLDELCAALRRGDNVYFSEDLLPQSLAQLEEARAQSEGPEEIGGLQLKVGGAALKHGNIDEAKAAFRAAQAAYEEAGNETRALLSLRALGIATMRGGEVDHCIAMHNPDSCLFPIKKSGVWANPAGAEEAMVHFEAYLKRRDDAGVRWLLNVAHMTAGTFPEGVPSEYRLPETVVREEHAIARFRDVAVELGVDTFSLAGGALMEDMDGDGWLDLVTSSIGPCEPMAYFHNEGDGTFADWSERTGVGQHLGGLNFIHADENGDGRLDLFLLRGAWLGPDFGRQRNTLLRQEPDGSFVDATVAAGLGDSTLPCLAADFGDYDNDGDLDLFVAHEEFQDALFQNQGDGTYLDVARAAGIDSPGHSKGVVFGDYDNDGWLDLFISNLGQRNLLYHNEGDGTFRSVESPVTEVVGSFATWFFDVNNDGWLDLYVGGRGATLEQTAADYFREPSKGVRQALYLNREGRFEDVSEAFGMADVRLPMGANFGDADNDGFLDFYLGTGKPSFDYLVPNVLYKNQGGEGFLNVTATAGVGHLQKGHGIGFGDLDNDGDQDIYAQLGGFYPSDQFHDALFENPGAGHRWITLLLRGTGLNRFAVGARVRVVVETPRGARELHRVVDSGGSFGSNSLQLEIGLGDALSITSVDVMWPGSVEVQSFDGIDLDRFYELAQGEANARPLERPEIRLGVQ